MAWVDISSTKVDYKDSYGSKPSGRTAICLQYDNSSETPESVKVRFKYYQPNGGTTNYWDSMYILYNADNSSSSIGNLGRTLFQLKGDTSSTSASWPYYSNSFTINKNYSSEEFTLQEFWICNYGSVNSSTASSVYNVFNSSRASLRCKVSSSTFSVSNTVAGAVGTGTITITDNGNNTFSVNGTKGADGNNNPATGPVISWGYTTSYSNSGSVTQQPLTITTPANATRTVYAKCVTGATYGSSKTATTSSAVKQYVAPSAPGIPALSYNKSRLTVKEPWTFTWKAATPANASSPICGYRIRIYKNDKLVLGLKPLQANSPAKVVLNAEGTNEFLDRDNTNNTLVIEDPASFGFNASDTVKLSVYAYTKYGTGNKLFSNTYAVSAKYTVQNAGIVNVNVGGSWKEGQVYVKINGTWKEAESVHTKAGGTWKEAQ
jgi:hypothetical protein